MNHTFIALVLSAYVAGTGCNTSVAQQSPREQTDPERTEGADPTKGEVTESLSCAQYPDRGKYWLRIQGDGDEQLFAEGTPISESGWRHCGPGGGLRERQLIAMGCAQASLTKRSCVFIMAPRVGYFDRDGVQHELTVATSNNTSTTSGIDGVITTKETLPGRTSPLRIEFHLTRCPWTENGMGCGPQCVSDEG